LLCTNVNRLATLYGPQGAGTFVVFYTSFMIYMLCTGHLSIIKKTIFRTEGEIETWLIKKPVREEDTVPYGQRSRAIILGDDPGDQQPLESTRDASTRSFGQGLRYGESLRTADDFQTIHAELERIQREENDALSGKNTSAASSPLRPPRPRAADDFTTIRKKVRELRSGPVLDASVAWCAMAR
jgi:hypothetical protein